MRECDTNKELVANDESMSTSTNAKRESMRALDILVKSRKITSMAEGRRLIIQGGLKVNGKIVTIQEGESVNDLEVPIKGGDTVKVGRQEFIWDDGTIWLDQ